MMHYQYFTYRQLSRLPVAAPPRAAKAVDAKSGRGAAAAVEVDGVAAEPVAGVAPAT